MGPFELMDLIGNDINFTVTKTVWEAFFYDQRYKPSFTQQRQVESGRLGRKSGRGYYSYADGTVPTFPVVEDAVAAPIVERILAMLINEAADALFWQVASAKDIDMAMTKGVNYPKGLLAWADEQGAAHWLAVLERLQAETGEDRYRPSPLLRKVASSGSRLL
jgi:3-hydroxybutyryl-CoA dehydrogenase